MTERNYPQYPMFDKPKTKDILYGVGLITHESNLKKTDEKRPLAERMDRAEFYKEFLKTDNKEKRKEILSKAKELDNVFNQFSQNQQEIKINIDGLGEQMARYIILEPSKPSDQPPIILLPGISNDLEGIGEMPIKLVASGRRVIEIAYPESWHGKVTKEFGDAVKVSDKFEPHTMFFKKAINQIIGEVGQIDLWGVSTGALIASNLLADNEFKQRVDKAALLVPPGEINHKNFNISMSKEFLSTSRKFWLTTKVSVSNPEKINTSEKHRELMLHTHYALKEKILKKYLWWNRNLETGTGNKTVVIIGNKDHITEAKKGKREIESNKTLNLYSIKLGNHSTPAVEAEMVINLVNNLQNKK